MLRKLHLLVPPFLQRFDRYLLVNHPTLWATRIHFVLFYGSLMLGLVYLKVSLDPVSLQDVPNPETGFSLLFLPVILAAGVWAFFVYMFRTDRSFGKLSPLGELYTQGVYLLGLGVLVAIPFVYGATLNSKIQNAISNEQLQEDLYVLNIGESYFNGNHPRYEPNWENYLNNNFVPYGLEDGKYQQLVKDLQSSTEEEARNHIERFLQTLAKYSDHHPQISAGKVFENFEAGRTSGFVLDDDYTLLSKVNLNLDRLYRAKTNHLWGFNSDSANVFLFSLLLVGFAFVIFVRSNWKQFLFALVASVGSAIVLAVFVELGREMVPALGGLREPTLFFLEMAGLMGILLLQVFSPFNSRRSAAAKSVSLIMAAGLMPVFLLFTYFGVNARFHPGFNDPEFSGLILAIFAFTFLLWNTVFSKRFRDIQSAPTSN